MRNPDQKYDELISRMKAVTPELDNPREMTDNILSAIKEHPAKPRISRTLYLSAWISSAAAIALILLFLSVYQMPLPHSVTRIRTPRNTTYSQHMGSLTNAEKKDIISRAIEIKRNQKNRQRYLQNYVLMNKLNN